MNYFDRMVVFQDQERSPMSYCSFNHHLFLLDGIFLTLEIQSSKDHKIIDLNGNKKKIRYHLVLIFQIEIDPLIFPKYS